MISDYEPISNKNRYSTAAKRMVREPANNISALQWNIAILEAERNH